MIDSQRMKLRLYVAGGAPNSQRALRNLAIFCSANTDRQWDLEVIDVFLDPASALENGILLTPSLSKVGAESPEIIIGDLSDEKVLEQFLAVGGAST